MKVRNVLLLSFLALLLISLFQRAGVWFAYRNQMQKAEATLAACFKETFTLVTDAQVNRLPYPEGTVTHIVYAPDSLHLDIEDRQLYYAEQTSAVLQDGYGLPETSLDSLRLTLTAVLQREGVTGSIYIRKLDAATGRTLQTSPAGVPLPDKGIGVLTSPRALLHPQKGIAVEAIADLHYFDHPSNLLFPGLTFLITGLLIGAIALRMRLLQRLRRDIGRQCEDFYQLAEQMSQPVRRMQVCLHASRWTEARQQGQQVLADTEATLTRAKQENARLRSRRTTWLRRLSWGMVPLAFVLPALWAGYIYHEQWRALNREVQVCIEEAFAEENALRHSRSLDVNHLRGTRKSHITGMTDYFHHQMDSLLTILYRKTTDEKGNTSYAPAFPGSVSEIYVSHQSMNLSEGTRLFRAYGTQQLVNQRPIVVPLDTLRLDSLFRAALTDAGLKTPGGIRIVRPATGQVVRQMAHAVPRWGSLVSTPLRLADDGVMCVQGVVPAPERLILRSAWYLFVPLGLTFAFCLLCIGLLWRAWRQQRRLEQFRKDFTYSMIHDMKSPLQTILMGTQIMESGRLADKPEKADKIVRAMNDECARLLTLSGRVVMLTQMDRGELKLHPVPVSLLPLFNDLAAKFRLKASKTVEFDIVCPESLCATADAFCLREVLSNLIDNAVKYSGPSVRIRLEAEATADGTLHIKVGDNGIGIPLNQQMKIFGKFERIASGSRTTGASGFGLGLNFVWQVVQAHGGNIAVQSREGSGSEFTVSLPSPILR